MSYVIKEHITGVGSNMLINTLVDHKNIFIRWRGQKFLPTTVYTGGSTRVRQDLVQQPGLDVGAL